MSERRRLRNDEQQRWERAERAEREEGTDTETRNTDDSLDLDSPSWFVWAITDGSQSELLHAQNTSHQTILWESRNADGGSTGRVEARWNEADAGDKL